LPRKAAKQLELLYGTHRLVGSKYQKPRVTKETFESPNTTKDPPITETKESIIGKYCNIIHTNILIVVTSFFLNGNEDFCVVEHHSKESSEESITEKGILFYIAFLCLVHLQEIDKRLVD
jgi:hypothetical protein